MRTVGTFDKVTSVPDDAINYFALALQARLTLVTSIIAAAQRRNLTQFDHSLYIGFS
jgi:hypothetical protein